MYNKKLIAYAKDNKKITRSE